MLPAPRLFSAVSPSNLSLVAMFSLLFALVLGCNSQSGGSGKKAAASKTASSKDAAKGKDKAKTSKDKDNGASGGKGAGKGQGAGGKGSDDADGDASGDGGSGADGDGDSPASLPLTEDDAFAKTLHPVLTKNCSSCHASFAAPLFAQGDVEPARLAILDSSKVNFVAPERSRLFLRLASDNHNCWGECTENAATMKAAIEEWTKLLLEINPKFLEEQTSNLVTPELNFQSAMARTPAADPLTIVYEAETATLTAPMVLATDPANPNLRYLEVPTGTQGGTINNANANNAGTSVFNINLATAGTYKVWALLNAATADNNDFFIRVDAGNFEEWETPVTMADWAWAQANSDRGRDELKFDLAAGAHTIEIKRRDIATRIDKIAVTMNPLFDGSQINTAPVQVLRFDISEVAGKPNTFLEVEVSDYSAAAFKVKRPTIVSEQALKVKDLRILVNGIYNPQHSSFNLVDVEVTPPSTQLSTAAMIVLKDQGLETDKISFTFGVLE